ncbi:MAG: DUF4396 domain-containing protein [Tannerellaceae bacterium]
MNEYFSIFAACWIISSILCAIIVFLHIKNGHPQEMKIMEAVWPLTALWSGVIGLVAYFKLGNKPMDMSGMDMKGMDMPEMKMDHSMSMSMSHDMKGMDMSAHHDEMKMGDMKMDMSKDMKGMKMPGMDMKSMPAKPFWEKVALSTLHCGAGCTLADLIGEWLVFFFPAIILGTGITGQWVLDYILALAIGIFFQYVAIQPMLHLSVGKGIMRALKIDFFSLSSWQVGMYGWMAIALFGIYHGDLPKTSWEFWFMMQLAMCAGFITAYPVNWILVKTGIKAGM